MKQSIIMLVSDKSREILESCRLLREFGFETFVLSASSADLETVKGLAVDADHLRIVDRPCLQQVDAVQYFDELLSKKLASKESVCLDHVFTKKAKKLGVLLREFGHEVKVLNSNIAWPLPNHINRLEEC